MALQFFVSFSAWPAVSILIGAIILLILTHRRYSTAISDIPGPFLASFTRLWHIKHLISGDHHLQVVRLHENHGHFVRISHNEVSISHPEGIRKILHSSLNKGPWYNIAAVPDYRFQNPFSTLVSGHKKERSKLFASGYTMTNLLQAEKDIDAHFQSLKRWMNKFAKEQRPVHLDKFITYTTYDVAGEMLFSKPFGFLKAGYDINNTIANTANLNLYVVIAGFVNWLHIILVGNPIITTARVLPMGHLYNTAMNALDQRQHNLDARFDILAHWFKTHQDQPEKLTVHDIRANTAVNVGAASDTVSIAIQSFIYHLIRNPAACQRLREEIDAASSKGLCQTAIILFDDARRLPYLRACINESLRIFGPSGFNFPRVVGKDAVTISGRTFPEGTILSVNPWAIHFSKEIWGHDAHEFRPERWLAESAATREQYLVAFGAGYAACPGQNLARIELTKLCATLFRDYDIRQVDPSQQWKWKARVTIMPHSWPVYIQNRESKQWRYKEDDELET
ncbi:cytochrome P450 [Pochonia chlamydosporia 170]|uniref:Cytochrome P450 n=1 Tax=Pochonia chlamydosporia 170 TaxID=1380566 RepID=A0A179EXE3_METCM|nr:cytochrome P450 [Pochonia chlamydosporia 170]OAQ57802.1 cytochrome P450 [Pochonia chlamydosporia 170]